MASKRQLKTKLQAVSNIKQTTRAMQLVAATKMRKSQERALSARPYALHAMEMLLHIAEHSNKEDFTSPFFESQKKKNREEKFCLVAVASDRGLAGAFNSQVLKTAMRFLEEHKNADLVSVGKKARDFFKHRNVIPVAEFLNFSDIVGLSDAEPLSQWLVERHLAGSYTKIIFCATQFISALNSRVEIREVLPIALEPLQRVIDGIIPEKGKYSELRAQGTRVNKDIAYVFEPSLKALFEELIEDLVRVEILHFLYESNASEHSSRMIAMKNATDNAENLITTLTLDLNKLRQSSITQELTEISTAKEALTSE